MDSLAQKVREQMEQQRREERERKRERERQLKEPADPQLRPPVVPSKPTSLVTQPGAGATTGLVPVNPLQPNKKDPSPEVTVTAADEEDPGVTEAEREARGERKVYQHDDRGSNHAETPLGPRKTCILQTPGPLLNIPFPFTEFPNIANLQPESTSRLTSTPTSSPLNHEIQRTHRQLLGRRRVCQWRVLDTDLPTCYVPTHARFYLREGMALQTHECAECQVERKRA
ncbi:hypothetical protein V8B97DRAFT_1965564 [Scleroderma yunnanense]